MICLWPQSDDADDDANFLKFVDSASVWPNALEKTLLTRGRFCACRVKRVACAFNLFPWRGSHWKLPTIYIVIVTEKCHQLFWGGADSDISSQRNLNFIAPPFWGRIFWLTMTVTYTGQVGFRFCFFFKTEIHNLFCEGNQNLKICHWWKKNSLGIIFDAFLNTLCHSLAKSLSHHHLSYLQPPYSIIYSRWFVV